MLDILQLSFTAENFLGEGGEGVGLGGGSWVTLMLVFVAAPA